MNGLDLFVDTNVLIKYLSGEEQLHNLILNNNIYCSFISELELYSKNSLSEKQEQAIQSLISGCNVLNFDTNLKKAIITMRRNYRLKLPDAIIAATALDQQMPFLTFDKDFEEIEALTIFTFS